MFILSMICEIAWSPHVCDTDSREQWLVSSPILSTKEGDFRQQWAPTKGQALSWVSNAG